MTKEQVQSRVLHNGKPLPLEDFTWNEEARVFSSSVNTLVLDFKHIKDILHVTRGTYGHDTLKEFIDKTK